MTFPAYGGYRQSCARSLANIASTAMFACTVLMLNRDGDAIVCDATVTRNDCERPFTGTAGAWCVA